MNKFKNGKTKRAVEPTPFLKKIAAYQFLIFKKQKTIKKQK
jgi:hypothetical protein